MNDSFRVIVYMAEDFQNHDTSIRFENTGFPSRFDSSRSRVGQDRCSFTPSYRWGWEGGSVVRGGYVWYGGTVIFSGILSCF